MSKTISPDDSFPAYEFKTINEGTNEFYGIKIYNAAALSLELDEYTAAHNGVFLTDDEIPAPLTNKSVGQEDETFAHFFANTPVDNLHSKSFSIGFPDFYAQTSYLILVEIENNSSDKLEKEFFNRFYEKANSYLKYKLDFFTTAPQEQTIDYALSWNLKHLSKPQQHLILLTSMQNNQEDTLAHELYQSIQSATRQSGKIKILATLENSGLVFPSGMGDLAFTKQDFLVDNKDGKNIPYHVDMIADILESLEKKNYALYLEREHLANNLDLAPNPASNYASETNGLNQIENNASSPKFKI